MSGNQQLLQYWQDLRGDEALPLRADFSPAAVTGLLPKIWIIGVLDGGSDFLIRLFGTRCVADTRADLTGYKLSETPPALETKWSRLYGAVLEDRRPVCAHMRLLEVDRGDVEIEAMALPFRFDDTDIKILINHYEYCR